MEHLVLRKGWGMSSKIFSTNRVAISAQRVTFKAKQWTTPSADISLKKLPKNDMLTASAALALNCVVRSLGLWIGAMCGLSQVHRRVLPYFWLVHRYPTDQ